MPWNSASTRQFCMTYAQVRTGHTFPVAVSGDPPDDMRWCPELEQRPHHGVAEVV
jgi:hypothetical protein